MRRFDGWEPVRVEEHEYDDDGRLMRTIVTTEPEWDGDERAWMLGLKLREDSECRRCGGDLVVTTDWQWSWKPLAPTVCLKCVALAQDEKTHAKSHYRAGLIHQVVKAERPKVKKRSRKRR